MRNPIKEAVKRLPYPALLRLTLAWWFAVKYPRFDSVRWRAVLPWLSEFDLHSLKRSQTLFILGSGPSINRIPAERWQAISRHDTLGVNFWLLHPFVPRIYVVESMDCAAHPQTCTRLVRAANQRAQDYRETLKIITDLFQPGDQYVSRLDPAFRENLYAAFNFSVPARSEEEFEQALRYISTKNAFAPEAGRVLFKYALSLSLLLTLAVKMQYRRVVLCGIDMNQQVYFYQDPELYPDTQDFSVAPRQGQHAANIRLPWMIPQASVVVEMERLLLRPAGIGLFVESEASALYPRIPLAPESVYEAPSLIPTAAAV